MGLSLSIGVLEQELDSGSLMNIFVGSKAY